MSQTYLRLHIKSKSNKTKFSLQIAIKALYTIYTYTLCGSQFVACEEIDGET